MTAAAGPPARFDRGPGGPGALTHGVVMDSARVQVLHAAVPGRLRLFLPPLKRAPELAGRVEAAAASWNGVRRAAASAVTGSLLIEYDPAATGLQSLAAAAQAEVDRNGSPVETDRLDTARSSRPGRVRAADPRSTARRSTEAPVPASPRRRVRAAEAALGGIALAAAGAALAAVRTHGHNLALDQVPLAVAEEFHHPVLTGLMRGASKLVEAPVLMPVTVGAALLGVGRRAPGDLPWLAPAAVFGGGTIVTVLKTILRRARPVAFEHLVPARGYSLPSGHAFLAVCLYGLLAHHGFRWLRARRPEDRWAAAVLMVAAATAVLLVGASRVYLGVHYPSDVIAGYALALLWLFFLAAINDRPREVS